jgi:hypothetical protein
MATFQCGKCNLIEENISVKTLMELSHLHFSGKHIDKYELRKLRKLKRKRWASK